MPDESPGGWRNSRIVIHAQIACVYLSLVIAVLFVWFQRDLLLLAFAGILVALFLRAVTKLLERLTHLTSSVSYLATLLLLCGMIVGIVLLLVPGLTTQLSEIVSLLPQSLQQIEKPLLERAWGRELLDEMHRLLQGEAVRARIPQIAGAVSNGAIDLVLIAAIGFFAALNPRGYREGTLILIPEPTRARIRRTARALHEQLMWWLLGQALSMSLMGVACGIGLWLLGVRLPWTLGLMTGVAVFIPYAGTITAGIPSVLMGLQRSPQTALYVLIFYTALHLLEGYALTPYVQRRTVRLPPVLMILSQFLMWNVAGVLGVALAAPLTTAGIALVKEAYLHVPPNQEVV